MGKTIDESMKVLQEVPKVMPITKESINVALDIMRKYQKIEQIINFRYTKSVSETLDEIVKVVEDGNNN